MRGRVSAALAQLAVVRAHWAAYYFPDGLLREAHPSLSDSVCLFLTSLAWYKIIFLKSQVCHCNRQLLPLGGRKSDEWSMSLIWLFACRVVQKQTSKCCIELEYIKTELCVLLWVSGRPKLRIPSHCMTLSEKRSQEETPVMRRCTHYSVPCEVSIGPTWTPLLV